MATIYNFETGNEITAGLQGSEKCDEAWLEAKQIASDWDEPVLLEDDDGEWVIHPDGRREPH